MNRSITLVHLCHLYCISGQYWLVMKGKCNPSNALPPRKVSEDFTWNCSIVCVQRYQNAKTPVRKDHEADCLELLFKCSDSPACTNNVYSQRSHPPRPVIKRPISLQSSDSLQAALHVHHGEILSCGSYQVNASPPNS